MPRLTINYKPRPGFNFSADYSKAIGKYVFEYAPGRENLRPMKITSLVMGKDWGLIPKNMLPWLQYLREEVGEELTPIQTSAPINDDTIHNAVLLKAFSALEETDRVITHEEKEKISDGFKIFLNGELLQASFTPEELERFKELTERIVQKMFADKELTRSKLRGLFERFLETTVFAMILEPSLRENIFNFFILTFKPIWDNIAAIAEYYNK